MSLFPAALNVSQKSTKGGNKKWLENKSFQDSEALLKAQQLHQHGEKLPQKEKDCSEIYVSFSDDDVEDVSDVETTEQVPQESQGAGIVIDKSKDKNNLFFKRPYKVYIPRYHRESSICMGLSPHLEIEFKRNKKKRKHTALDRYYHHDTSMDADEDVTASDVKLKVETEKLNVKTREHPEDVTAWMSLVQLQDKMGTKNVKLTVERKNAILDRAISANPTNVQLKLHRLKLLESISEDAEREWKDLVFRHPGNRVAWEAYISRTKVACYISNFSRSCLDMKPSELSEIAENREVLRVLLRLRPPRPSPGEMRDCLKRGICSSPQKGSSFSVRRALKVYERCLQTWMAIHDGSFNPKEPCPDIEDDMVFIFKDLTQFLLESGHTELCFVLLVLMVEVNIRTLDCKSVADVEGFYRSGDPLLGEPGSAGWKAWSVKNERGGWVTTTAADGGSEDDDELEVDCEKSLAENWLSLEESRSLKNWFPWRSEAECEDIGRKVAFEDVRGFLFFTSRSNNKLTLLKLLLSFFGKKLELEDDSGYLLGQPCQLTHATSSTCLPGDTSSIELNCDETCTFGVLPRKTHHEFLCSLFKQLHTSCPPEFRVPVADVCLDYFAGRTLHLCCVKSMKQELKRTHKEAKGLAKVFLQADPMNFLLWCKLARVESLAGKKEDCKKIFYNALCMCKSKPDATLLCRGFAENMHDSDPDAVKLVLSALGDDLLFADYLQAKKSVTGVVLLRAARSLERLCEDLSCLYQQIERGDVLQLSTFANAVFCYAYYVRFTSDASVVRTLQPYIDVIRRQKNAGFSQAVIDLKHVHRLRLKLIKQDKERRSLYRTCVLSALDDYPSDPCFSTELCKVEVGSSILSVARRSFGTLETTIQCFFAVYFELLRQKQDQRNGTVAASHPPRVLNLLERAVTRHETCAFLWRLYVKLSPDPGPLLVRAAMHCPWSKAIACDTVRCQPNDVNKVLRIINDNGIRLRTPVEEVELLLSV